MQTVTVYELDSKNELWNNSVAVSFSETQEQLSNVKRQLTILITDEAFQRLQGKEYIKEIKNILDNN